MAETPREPPLTPGERIEHHEVTERVSPKTEPAPIRRGPGILPWLIALVILVLVLVWYVLSRAEPTSPIDAIDNVEIGASDGVGEP